MVSVHCMGDEEIHINSCMCRLFHLLCSCGGSGGGIGVGSRYCRRAWGAFCVAVTGGQLLGCNAMVEEWIEGEMMVLRCGIKYAG